MKNITVMMILQYIVPNEEGHTMENDEKVLDPNGKDAKMIAKEMITNNPVLIMSSNGHCNLSRR